MYHFKVRNSYLPVRIEKMRFHSLLSLALPVLCFIVTSVDEVDDYGYTPIMWSSLNNQKEVTLFLIKKGANLNLTDGSGVTPLMAACAKGSLKVVDILLENNADVNLGDLVGIMCDFISNETHIYMVTSCT